ncbi:MAG: hypothetical protein EBZ47_01730 [Chlamydiae bacterium]|nr:hypothetical protein [Chlamydiota bacterium]
MNNEQNQPNQDLFLSDSQNDSAQEIAEPSTNKSEEKQSSEREPSKAFKELLESLLLHSNTEEKIKAVLNFMKLSLSNPQLPRFRDFWDARRFCLPMFKETMNAKTRNDLWVEYLNISTEARRLKEILDEQSAFAYEQIDLAVQSLVKDLQNYDDLHAQIEKIEVPSECTALVDNQIQYADMQSHLQLLNTFASRVNSLRKEVIKTEMRIKNKNKLFEKLSAAGDLVFPKRKILIKDISDLFAQDVSKFTLRYFEKQDPSLPPLHTLREEIKGLQNFAKSLTLNAATFNETRLKLSNCWDKLKEFDKERKKDMLEKRQASKQIFESIQEKVQLFAQFCQNIPALSEVQAQFEEILALIKASKMNFSDQKTLKDELFLAKKPVLDKEKELQQERELKSKEMDMQKKQKIISFKENLETLLKDAPSMELDLLLTKQKEVMDSYPALNLVKAEKLQMDALLRNLRDVIDESKSKKILSLSDGDREKLNELSTLLVEKRQRRAEIKNQIESFRKILGGSGFDFEKAMMYRDRLEEEKLALDKIDLVIREIEEKISEIEG